MIFMFDFLIWSFFENEDKKIKTYQEGNKALDFWSWFWILLKSYSSLFFEGFSAKVMGSFLEFDYFYFISIILTGVKMGLAL